MNPSAIKRIVSDLAVFHQNKPEGIFLHSDEEDISRHVVLIVGPEGTPYEDGFFFFEMVFPEDYPFSPPRVEIRTTNPETRFNPNFYLEGKVCLSILGTWQGPSWQPTMTIDTVLLSIQTRMNEWPLENEPGYEDANLKQKLKYNEIVRELTIRFSVIDQLKNGFPKTKINNKMSFEPFRPIVTKHFLNKYANYLKIIDSIPNTLLTSHYGRYQRQPDHEKLRSGLQSLQSLLTLLNNPSDLSEEKNTCSEKRSSKTRLKIIVPIQKLKNTI
jgi:ubiquitin-conjugating enzyme E2 Z